MKFSKNMFILHIFAMKNKTTLHSRFIASFSDKLTSALTDATKILISFPTRSNQFSRSGRIGAMICWLPRVLKTSTLLPYVLLTCTTAANISCCVLRMVLYRTYVTHTSTFLRLLDLLILLRVELKTSRILYYE